MSPRKARRHAAVALSLVAAAGCRHGAVLPPAGAPVVVLVSLDGFHPDYLVRFATPHLHRLAARGVRARWMTPSFPTLTFPNHYTVATGLYPAHHGIVANTFRDPETGVRVRLADTAVSYAERWWGGEPVWVTAERQGRRAATFYWPGTDVRVGGVRPTEWKPYDERVPDSARVDTVVAWLARPAARLPALVTLYFSAADDVGHDAGPDGPQLVATVAHLDSMVGRLLDGLARLGLDRRLNIIVLSDHGMAPISRDRVVVLDDYASPGAVEVLQLGAFVALRPRDGDADGLLRALARAPHLTVYRRDATPERWRYRGHPRIAEVVGVPDPGWVLVTRAALARRAERGAHGYDNTDSTMRALFIAAGPAFRRGAVVAPFLNVHVYELVCAILGLTPAPNDGSLDSVRALLRVP